MTGRSIKIGSPTWKALIKEGLLRDENNRKEITSFVIEDEKDDELKGLEMPKLRRETSKDYNFDTLQRAVRSLIESITITYVGGNTREYYIFIKYVGTSTMTQFKTNHMGISGAEVHC